MKTSPFICFILFLFLAQASFAGTQDTVWLKWKKDTSRNIQATNRILEELAFENGLSYRKIKLGYVLYHQKQINDSSVGKWKVVLHHITGPTKYLGYDLSDFLLPLYLQAYLQHSFHGIIYTQEVKLEHDTVILEFSPKVNLSTDSLSLHFRNANLDEEIERQLKRVMDEIKTYRGLCASSLYFENVLRQGYNPHDPRISDILAELIEGIRVKESLDSMFSALILPLEKTDPCNLYNSLKAIDIEIYRHRLAFERLLDTDPLSPNDLTPLSDRIFGFWISWIRHEEFSNPLNNGVIAEVARLDPHGKWIEMAHELLHSALLKMGYTNEDEFLKNLSRQLTKKMLQEGEALNKQTLFIQANIILNNALKIAQAADLEDETQAVESQIKVSVRGLYNTYLKVARDGILNGNIVMGEFYLKKALEYQSENREILLGSQPSKSVYEIFSDVCLDKAIILNKEGKFEQALPFLEKAMEYAGRQSIYLRQQEIKQTLSKTLQEIYRQKVISALSSMQLGNYIEGKRLLDEALTMKKTNATSIESIPDEDSAFHLYQKASLYVVMDSLIQISNELPLDSLLNATSIILLRYAENLADDSLICKKKLELGKLQFERMMAAVGSLLWDFKIEEAHQLWLNANKMIPQWNLQDCSEINERLNEMAERIEIQECRFARYRLELFEYKVRSAFQEGDYLMGDSIADSALQIKTSVADCPLDDSGIAGLLHQYHSLIEYNRLLEQLTTTYETLLADSLEKLRLKLYSLISSDSSISREFPLPDTIWLVELHPSEKIINYYFENLKEENRWSDILNLIEKFRQSGLSADWFETWQENLGHHLARIDKIPAKKEASLEYLDQMLPDRVWYKTLRKAYLKEKLGWRAIF
ncbi:MAG TPA: hypothetical protein PK028_03105 [Bacteroidales bacterium]|jgi:tetratricopeptide (TPR) repeat protein|nr:hypothetical protein [Bacteroidales bacterium]MDI9574391.1 hypothetical protein [Bacteroidota bacterium]MBP9511347.1 hypothetical protein [Bacteroidales bacterium]MBP9587870.1 hypothetical protein [Bacteroidales bacterium]HOE58778.1 hypothetical protein [Bacteroidales bacterium]